MPEYAHDQRVRPIRVDAACTHQNAGNRRGRTAQQPNAAGRPIPAELPQLAAKRWSLP